ncbi:MAG: ribonuclease HII [Deltaproteobacteria bacterium]|nr:ribonuclease HII [Deltaproteobacteria bacterium]
MSKTDPLYYESLARKHGYQWIAGVDEAGRGPLAGPVVAAAVIIPEGALLQGVKDSKKMTEKAREKAFEEIHKIAVAVGVGVISHRAIDQMNILNATLTAMKQAVVSLDPLPDHVFVDGIHEIPISIPQKCLIKGDQICKSISAASIIAKVYRDRIMSSYHDRFPEYGFLHHKGYGTAQHRSVIAFLGPSPVHRLTFKGVKGLDTGKN